MHSANFTPWSRFEPPASAPEPDRDDRSGDALEPQPATARATTAMAVRGVLTVFSPWVGIENSRPEPRVLGRVGVGSGTAPLRRLGAKLEVPRLVRVDAA